MSYLDKLRQLQQQREDAMSQGKAQVDEQAGSAYERAREQYSDKLEHLKKPYEQFQSTMNDIAGISGTASAIGKAVKKLREGRAKPEEAKPEAEEDVSSPADTVTQETNRDPATGESTSASQPDAPLSSEETTPVTQANTAVNESATSTEADVVRPGAQAQEATESSAFDVGETPVGNAKVISDFKASANQPDLIDEPFSAPRTLTRTITQNPVSDNVSTDLHTNPSSADVQNSGASAEDISSAQDAITGASTAEAGEAGAEAGAGVLSTALDVGSVALDAIPVVGEVAMLGSLLASFFSGASEKKAETKVPEPTEPPEAPQIVGAGYDVRS